MAHNVMTLLKTALSKFRSGEGTVGVAEGWMSLLSSAVTKDIFWDSSRRFVKYCGGCKTEALRLLSQRSRGHGSQALHAPWSPGPRVSP